MKYLSKRAALPLVLFFLIFSCAFSVNAQTAEPAAKYTEWNDKDVFPLINASREIDLKGCIQTDYGKDYVIKDEETFLKTIRTDASRDSCLEELKQFDYDKKIDFGEYTLLGIQINSGYCGVPLGLNYHISQDKKEKRYLLDISYIDPGNSTCRALSQYDLWMIVPKFPDDYEVKFEVSARRNEN